MRCWLFRIFVSGAWQSALGCSWSALKSSRERIKEQARALCHAPLPNIQKSLQRIFATLCFLRSFFYYLFLQRFTLRGFFNYLFLQRFILSAVFLTIYFDWDCIFLYI